MQAGIDAVVIGGSSGALEALATVLPALPATSAVPIVIVVHLPPDRPSHLAAVLGARTVLRVREAEDKEPLAPGVIYVGPPNYHLLIERGGTFALSADDLLHFSRPSIDVLFESAADAYGSRVAGVLLSGANADGADGLATIRRAGGVAITQSPEAALVRTMPEAAIARARPDYVLGLPEMAELISRLTVSRTAKELR
ncbi:MAG TPA: chemotaxis protein CheB [Polyangia bacterium]|nr:chemotaxis protein CheB [Polyangia bacterium]